MSLADEVPLTIVRMDASEALLQSSGPQPPSNRQHRLPQPPRAPSMLPETSCRNEPNGPTFRMNCRSEACDPDTFVPDEAAPNGDQVGDQFIRNGSCAGLNSGDNMRSKRRYGSPRDPDANAKRPRTHPIPPTGRRYPASLRKSSAPPKTRNNKGNAENRRLLWRALAPWFRASRTGAILSPPIQDPKETKKALKCGSRFPAINPLSMLV